MQAICNKLATVRFSAPTLPAPPTTTPQQPPSSLPLAVVKEEGEGEGEGVAVEPDPNWNEALAAAVRRGKAEAVAAVLGGMEGACGVVYMYICVYMCGWDDRRCMSV